MPEDEFNQSMQRSLERVVARGVSRHYAIQNTDQAFAIIVDLIDASVLARRLIIDLGDGNQLSIDAVKRSLTRFSRNQQGRTLADVAASSPEDIVRHLHEACRGASALSIRSEILSGTSATEETILMASELAEHLALRADERIEPAPSILLQEMSNRGLAIMTQAGEWTDFFEPAIELSKERLLIQGLLDKETEIRTVLDEDNFLELQYDSAPNRNIVVCLEDRQIVFLIVEADAPVTP